MANFLGDVFSRARFTKPRQVYLLKKAQMAKLRQCFDKNFMVKLFKSQWGWHQAAHSLSYTFLPENELKNRLPHHVREQRDTCGEPAAQRFYRVVVLVEAAVGFHDGRFQ